mmetsp:Transcript_32916/g.79629  ORF Transcript_32916/g.79629 Transcript_32916/m.79629 type:complete len:86 (-) Transcript_32916:322-579(-)
MPILLLLLLGVRGELASTICLGFFHGKQYSVLPEGDDKLRKPMELGDADTTVPAWSTRRIGLALIICLCGRQYSAAYFSIGFVIT